MIGGFVSMSRKVIFMLLFTLLTQASLVTPAMTKSNEEKIREHAAKVKLAIAKLGVGESVRVEVKLRDKNKLKGYIRDAAEDRFVVVDAKTGEAATVTYQQVKQVKGNNLSTGTKIVIWLAIAAGVLLFLSLGVDD